MAATFPDNKKEAALALLEQPVLARLATASGATLQPHVVPVWFWWDGESIWISAFSSTRKVKDLVTNKLCAVLIEPKETKILEAVLFEGPAKLIEQPRELVRDVSLRIYTRYMGVDGVQAKEPQSWAVDDENRLVKLTPAQIFVW